jgi:tRNA(Ile)-lysidine synthase
VASADLSALQGGPDAGITVATWKALSPARQAAVLRHWLRPAVAEGVRETLIERLLLELPGARAARWPVDATLELRLYRGNLTLAGLAPPTAPVDLTPIRLDQPGRLALPAWGGTLELTPVEQGGVSRSLLVHAGLRDRLPGDQFQLAPRSIPRSLKKQFQALGVPGWERTGPILAAAGQVVFVPGLGIDARAQATPGEPQLSIRWEPAP